MIIEGRKNTVLTVGLLWAAIVVAAYLIAESYELDMNWGVIAASLLLLIISLVTLSGEIRLFFPYIFFSKKDLLEYNIKKISFFLGISMAIASYLVIFITMDVLMLVPVICAAVIVECSGLYTCASNKFRADRRPENAGCGKTI